LSSKERSKNQNALDNKALQFLNEIFPPFVALALGLQSGLFNLDQRRSDRFRVGLSVRAQDLGGHPRLKVNPEFGTDVYSHLLRSHGADDKNE